MKFPELVMLDLETNASANGCVQNQSDGLSQYVMQRAVVPMENLPPSERKKIPKLQSKKDTNPKDNSNDLRDFGKRGIKMNFSFLSFY